ncbi:MAG: N-acetylmuramoyl-L-alanine amidase, partial [Pseudomonadota bacterium]
MMVMTLTTLAIEAQGATILLDPGHGGEDLGAIVQGKKKKIYEKDLTLQMAKRIMAKLKAKGQDAYLTRSIDRTVTLNERAEQAEKVKAD